MARTLKDRLVDALTQRGMLTPEQLRQALEQQRQQGGSLSERLVTMGVIEQQTLINLLSRELQIPFINLTRIQVDRALVSILPPKLARYYQVVPVSLIGQTLTVAMADPLNVLALDDLAAATGLSLAPLVATREQIQALLQDLYGASVAQTVQELAAPSGAPDQEEPLEVIELRGAETHRPEELIRMVQETPVVRTTEQILQRAVALQASDILIEPFESRLRIRYRVDGLLQEGESPPHLLHEGIVSRLKVLAALDVTEHRLPQDGRFQITAGARPVDFRVSVVPSSFGEKVVLRVLDRSQARLELARLGFDGPTLEVVRRAAGRPHGMILVTGPTGSGKSTTLYSILKLLDAPTKNLVTVEDPVEYAMEGVNQVAVNAEIGLTFAACLRAILRQDPNVIMVGEIRDGETADIAIKAALTGHLVLSTLHTNDAIGAVARLMNIGVEPFLISASLALVGAQRLLRTICRACQEPAPLTPSAARYFHRTGEPPMVARGRGCPACHGTGYRGRAGILETLTLDATVREMITRQATEQELRAYARKAGMPSLAELAADAVFAGVTTPDEAIRVTVGAA